ncbi:MAG TPA: hypothetical protein VFC46_04025 [Humisphaera sp.]|nr:hypothetical protein [Humisphaera sp.]
MATPLDYSSEKTKRPLFRVTIPRAIVLLFLMIAFYWMMRGDLRTSADIRLDTGDLRYRYFGIPWEYHRMPEPVRSELLKLGAGSKIITSEWRKCADLPYRSSCNEAGLCREHFIFATAWVREDPQLARLMFEDLARMLKGENNDYSLDFLFIRYVEWSGSTSKVMQNWRQDPELLDYMARKHYAPPSTQPSPAAQ